MSARSAAWRGAIAAVLLMILVPVADPGASAQTASTTTSTTTVPSRASSEEPLLRLASQTPWVGRGGDFLVRLLVESERSADPEVAVTVHQRVTSRSAFEQTLLGTVRGSALTVAAQPLSELTRDAAGAVTVRLPIQDPSFPRDPGRIALTREGVYPVRVELRERGGGAVLAGLTTHLVHVPEPVQGSRLGFVWILPVQARPAIQPDATRALGARSTAAFASLARALESHPGVPVVLRPTPETIESLAASPRAGDREVVARLTRSLGGRQVLTSTYVRVNLSQLLAANLDDELATQRARGAEVLSTTLRVRPDPRTWVVDGRLDDPTLSEFRRQQIDRLVVEERALRVAASTVTPTQPFTVEGRATGRRAIRAFASDAGVSSHFRATGDPVLAAHQLLADLAVIHFDRPGKPRAVVGVAPPSWHADARFLDIVLGGLSSSTILAGTTLDAAFSTVPVATAARSRPLVRRIEPAPRATGLPAGAIGSARRRLEGFSQLVDPGNPIFESLDRVLLAGQSSEVTGVRREVYIDGVRRGLDAELDHIEMPGNRTITLTARRGEIPVTIRSRTGYPIRAVLRVDSDKLDFPSGERRDLSLERENTTQRFAVRARTSGAFPLRVSLESGDGRLVLGRSLFTVRSTAASGVGVILSLGAGVFLVLWWALHLARARRRTPAP